MKTPKDLSPKHRRFVQEFLIDQNATAAYKRAGYKGTGHTAEANASRLLRDAEVSAAITAALAEAAKQSIATIDRLEVELQRIALADIRRLFGNDGTLKPPAELDDDTAAAVASVDVIECGTGDDKRVTHKIKLWDKRQALVDLLKRRDAAKSPPPPPVPGSSTENPVHVANKHELHPDVLRSFFTDLKRAGIGRDADGMPPNNSP
jgi:phage terminase small subunit